ncbi:receptor-like protein kinase ANXUR1 [Argentina anserina]|uniref:receptor-like protein kinase ANXUR1 n=1 Tax=Argentina anserina TaxID=57926 RepID=UPI0021764E98|nr:receptor-like protein kinase ANXUR1 [Potentilla anserina]
MICNTKILCILILLFLSLYTIHVLARDSDNKDSDNKDSNSKNDSDSGSESGKKENDSGSDSNKDSDEHESYLISCGSQNEAEDSLGRKWVSDSKFLTSSDCSLTEELNKTDPTLPSEVPYKSVRIFNATSSYMLSVTTKTRLWIRLHFYPFDFGKVEPAKAYFSVIANEFTLLKNFSAFNTAASLTEAYIVKEFSLTPVTCGKLNITIIPSTQPESSIGFLNGIEVIPMPDIFKITPLVGFHDQTIEVQNSSVQTMYRLNIGGDLIPPTEDAEGGGNRTWHEDGGYLIGAPATKFGVVGEADSNNVTIQYQGDVSEYIAPEAVYKTARSMGPSPNVNLNTNLTWQFEVDANFTYVVRLHFCDFELEMTNQRVFDIFLNNHTAQQSADVIGWAGRGSSGRGTTVYKDYAIYLNDRNNGAEQIWVALHPSDKTQPEYYDSLLNGLEVFKLNDTCGNFGSEKQVPIKRYCYSDEFLQKAKVDDADCKPRDQDD